MKTILVFLLLTLSFTSFSHDYFFAFAEVKYNDFSNKIESTVTISTHDLEVSLKEEKFFVKPIEEIVLDSRASNLLELYLLKHFKISSKEDCELKLIGMETLLNGVTNFYFESSEIVLDDSITFVFDVLMSSHQEQQNKMTFYFREQTITKAFLYNKRTQTIKLVNN